MAIVAAVFMLGVLSGCGDTADLPVSEGTGPTPVLPPPKSSLIPTVNIAPATGWPGDAVPSPAEGLKVSAFARRLDHPRWLYVLPNGDVLVAESNAPAKSGGDGIKSWVASLIKKWVGAGVPSADRITLLRDSDGDGVAESRSVFLEGLHSPFGMALVGEKLFVANTDAVMQFPYRDGQTRIDEPGKMLVALPSGKINQHWTRNLLASPDGTRLYVAVGSASNIAEHGLEEERGRAAIWEVDPATGKHGIFASGLRNPVGMDWEPVSGALWTAVNERDELGSDLVPDYMTAVQRGDFYGWPFSYFGRHVDKRVEPQRPDLVARASVPDYALGPHTASLGLAFAGRARLGPRFASGVFIGQHGSWNRDPPSGYKVIFVPFEGGRPAGMPIEVLTGFLGPDGDARGRPVGVAIDASGALLVADDVGNAIWRVESR
tara:strand:- start:340 stop:1638 length:1299 start_codon:yes stop_codon:yes gene_type:complete